MTAPSTHVSVLLEEALAWLVGPEDGLYVDATYGRGGHTRTLLGRLSASAGVVAVDQDPEAVRDAEHLAEADTRLRVCWSSFAALSDLLDEHRGRIDGILFDLGVSSPQLDDAGRGFSFRQDGPLDMRMNTAAGQTAADWVNTAPEAEISRVLFEYGEERFARRMARAIVTRRSEMPFTRTLDLAEVVKAANPRWEKHKHPATRAFQAIRIHINNELQALEQALAASIDLLAPGGRLVVISFHSLEDRMVKRFMRDQAKGPVVPRHIPVREQPGDRALRVLVRGRKADDTEVSANVRARSAVLRVAERLPAGEASS